MMKITFSCLMFNPEEQSGCNEMNQQADFVFDQRFVSGRFGRQEIRLDSGSSCINFLKRFLSRWEKGVKHYLGSFFPPIRVKQQILTFEKLEV